MKKIALLLLLLLGFAPLGLASSIEMPEAGAGETLYLGSAQYDQAESFEVAFVLSADGSTIRDTTLFIKGMTLEFVSGNTKNNVTLESGRQRYAQEYQIAEGADIDMGTLKLLGIRFDEGRIEATVDYVYTHTNYSANFATTEVPLGQREIVFTAQ